MKKCKSNLTGEATFMVQVKKGDAKDWSTTQTFGSVTPCNKASYAEVKQALAECPEGAKRLFTGRPDLGYIVSEVVKGEQGESTKTILEVRVALKSDLAKKTFIGAPASLAARQATLAPWAREEPKA